MNTSRTTEDQRKMVAFELGRQRLLAGRWREAQEGTRRYLTLEDLPPRLMRQWHLTAGIDTFVKACGGPERPDLGGYRGDIVGHYLSATAKMLAATGDEAVARQGKYVVEEVARCQETLKADGFVAGFPLTRLAQVERGCFALVPYYTMHKIMAGLLDQFVLAGNGQAMEVLEKLAGHIKRRIEKLEPGYWQTNVLSIEYGGMLEFGMNLYAVTGRQEHLELAWHFDEKSFYEPMAEGKDILTDRHANSTIPKAVSAARAYQVTGQPRWLAVAKNFWEMYTRRRMYVCGGSDTGEMWFDPGLMSRSLSPGNHEFCCVYNMLKLSRYLLEITGEGKYADYIERGTVNTVLGTVRPADGMIGSSLLGMSTGCRRTWSTPFDSFWCCVGTGMESGGLLGEGVFYHDQKHTALTVARYAAAKLDWTEKGVTVEQETAYPDDGEVKLTVRTKGEKEFALRLYVPRWAEGMKLTLSGKPLEGVPDEQGFVTVKRRWRDGDRVEVKMPMRLYTEALYGDDEVRAVRCGPTVLAGVVREDEFTKPGKGHQTLPAPTQGPSTQDWYLEADAARVGEWLRPAKGVPLTFRTAGVNRDLTFIPMNRVEQEYYGVYWPMLREGTGRLGAIRAAHEAAAQFERRCVVDRVRVGEAGSEQTHAMEAGESKVGHHAGWAHRGGAGPFAYTMRAPAGAAVLLVSYFAGEAGWRGFEARVEGVKVGSAGVSRMPPCEFRTLEAEIPAELTKGKKSVKVSFHTVDAEGKTSITGIYTVAIAAAGGHGGEDHG